MMANCCGHPSRRRTGKVRADRHSREGGIEPRDDTIRFWEKQAPAGRTGDAALPGERGHFYAFFSKRRAADRGR